MIMFDLRQIVKPQLDQLGDVFYASYVVGKQNPIFRSLLLRVAAEVLDRAGKFPSDESPIDLNEHTATAEQLEQAQKFFSSCLADPDLRPARYRHSREFFTLVLAEVNAEIARGGACLNSRSTQLTQ
jgi:hypothetical protein